MLYYNSLGAFTDLQFLVSDLILEFHDFEQVAYLILLGTLITDVNNRNLPRELRRHVSSTARSW